MFFSGIKNIVLGRLLNCLGLEDKEKKKRNMVHFLKSFLEDFFTVIYPSSVDHTQGYKVCVCVFIRGVITKNKQSILLQFGVQEPTWAPNHQELCHLLKSLGSCSKSPG